MSNNQPKKQNEGEKVSDSGIPEENSQATKGAQQEIASALSSNETLQRFAEQIVLEAHKVAENIKEEARAEGRAEVSKLLADAEQRAHQQAQRILEAAQEEIAAQSKATLEDAEQQARQLLRAAQRERDQLLKTAEQKAYEIRSEATMEVELMVRKASSKVSDHIRKAISAISSDVLEEVERRAGATDASGADREIVTDSLVSSGAKVNGATAA